jgi:arabinogalactan oligomer / maltooligosaccharide transport system permease protein
MATTSDARLTTLSREQPGFWRRFLRVGTPYIYLLPAFIVMVIITFYPMGFQVWMSFTDYGLKSLRMVNGHIVNPPTVVGLQNYIRILTTDLAIPNFNFLHMLIFNLWWTFSNVIVHVALGIVIAVILNTEGLLFKGIYRAIYILPIVLPQIIIANVWRNMYDPDYGAVNQGLSWIAKFFLMGPVHIRWIDQIDPPIAGIPLTLSYFALLICNIWLGWPFMTIVATGALQSIPKDLYEAAEIDGASGNQQFWRITLPLLRPAMVPAAVYGLIVTFNLFSLIYFLSGGGPLRQTEILLTQAYRLVNEQQLYGVAAAFCVYIFFILLVLTIFVNRVTRATESYDV